MYAKLAILDLLAKNLALNFYKRISLSYFLLSSGRIRIMMPDGTHHTLMIEMR